MGETKDDEKKTLIINNNGPKLCYLIDKCMAFKSLHSSNSFTTSETTALGVGMKIKNKSGALFIPTSFSLK